MLDAPDFKEKQIIFFFPSRGDKLSYKNDNIVIKDKDGKIKYQSTCYLLFMLFVVGHTSITTGLIQRSKKFDFSICFMSTGFKVYDIIGGKMEGNTVLRKRQYFLNDYNIGKHLISNKIQNQIENLNSFRKKTVETKEAIELLREHESKVYFCDDNTQSIMGVEGSAARTYFTHFFNNVAWKGRKPRIKFDYINTTLDIGYNLLFNFIEALLSVYGFDLYYGVLHRCFYMRKSLVCDVMEPFRAIVEYQVRKSINLSQFKEEDFELRNNQYILKREKTPEYVNTLLHAIIEYKSEIFYYIQSFYRAFMKQKKADDFPVFFIERS